MKNNIIGLLIIAIFFSGGISLANDSIAAVVLAGGVIKAKSVDNTKKYKRKDCPVCKGKGWYLSGDEIEKVPCGYCEEEKGSESMQLPQQPTQPNKNTLPPRTIIRRR